MFAHGLSNLDYDTQVYGSFTGKYKSCSQVANGSETSTLAVYSNEQVTYNKDNIWSVYKPAYWPNPSKKDDGTVVRQYVSFFAYAPYAGTNSAGEIKDATSGILGWNLVHNLVTKDGKVNTDDLSKAIADISYRDVDPVIHYKATKGTDGKMVDLLWGTAGTNSKTFDNAAQDGEVVGDTTKTTSTDESSGEETTTTTIDRAGLDKVNVNLQKMVKGGKVGFNFKHALARLGGIKGVYADITNSENEKDFQAGETNAVTVNWIAIELTSSDETLNIPTEGYFNLVTGKWATVKNSVASGSKQTPMVYFLSGNVENFTQGNGLKYARYHFNLTKENDQLSDDQKAAMTELAKNTIFCYKGYSASGWKENEMYGSWEKSIITSTPTPLIADGETYTAADVPAFYLIPDGGDTKIKAKVIVNWNADNGYPQTQSAEVELPKLASNTAYKLYIHLDVQTINVKAEVSEWTDAKDNTQVYPEPGNNRKTTGTSTGD